MTGHMHSKCRRPVKSWCKLKREWTCRGSIPSGNFLSADGHAYLRQACPRLRIRLRQDARHKQREVSGRYFFSQRVYITAASPLRRRTFPPANSTPPRHANALPSGAKRSSSWQTQSPVSARSVSASALGMGGKVMAS